jgi:hypothetical protein
MTLRSLLIGYDRWWFRKAPPHALAILRIGFGAFLLFYWGIRLPHAAMLYSREGILLPMPAGPLSFLFAPPSPQVATLRLCLMLSALLSFTVGFRTRLSAAVTFILYVYYWRLSLFQLGASFDRLFLFFLLILACSGCGKTLSADMRLRKGSFFAWEPVSIFPQRLIAMQIAATYLGVGWQKLTLRAWWSGEVLSVGFMGRWATPPAWAIARLNLPIWVYDAQVYLVKLFELTIPFGLWFRKTRWWYMLGGLLFHTGITILLGIWWFQVLIPAYIVFFQPEEVYGFLKRRLPDRIA